MSSQNARAISTLEEVPMKRDTFYPRAILAGIFLVLVALLWATACTTPEKKSFGQNIREFQAEIDKARALRDEHERRER